MDKSSLYHGIAADLMIRETYDDALQFVTTKQVVTKRIQVENEIHGFGKFFYCADEKKTGNLKRAFLYPTWLFNLREVGQYLAQIAGCKYTIEYKLRPRQEYKRIRGDSSE